MPRIRIPRPFDHADWLFEVKLDGFRALASRVISAGSSHGAATSSRSSRYSLRKSPTASTLKMRFLGGEVVCDDGISLIEPMLSGQAFEGKSAPRVQTVRSIDLPAI